MMKLTVTLNPYLCKFKTNGLKLICYIFFIIYNKFGKDTMAFPRKLEKLFNPGLILQSAPTLLLTLIGMIFTGLLFRISITTTRYKKYPIILESGCILSFKGNIELGLAMHLSSRKQDQMTDSSFAKSVFFNCNAIFIQSFITGLLAGIVGGLQVFLINTFTRELFIKIILGSVLTCIATSMIFILFLLSMIQVSSIYKIKPENFILPLLSTINDFVIVRGLLLSAILLEDFSIKICMVIGSSLLLLLCINVFVALYSENLIPHHSIEILAASYMLSVFGGYLLEKYSSVFVYVVSAFPVFAGMCGSILFIHIHRKFIIEREQTSPMPSQRPTLLLISFLIATLYIIIAHALGLGYSLGFSLAFILVFCCQIIIMLFISDKLCYKTLSGDIHPDILPMVSSSTDFVSALILIAIAFCLQSHLQNQKLSDNNQSLSEK